MSLGRVLIRADAGPTIGHGHAMRCLALAQAWQDAGGDAEFALAQPPPALVERLCSERVSLARIEAAPGSVEDAAQLLERAAAQNAVWVVVDGYHFSSEYQDRIKDAGLKLLLVDDLGGGDYRADLVLNQNLHATKEMYVRRESYTRLLLGPRYALLRREFGPWRDWKREIVPVARRVLVTMGGSDPENLTARAVEALAGSSIQGLEAAVVIGASNRRRESLERLGEKSGGAVRFHQDVADIAKWMAWADMAISGAGSTCWEMCFLGLPALLIDLAPNQRRLGEELQRKGAAIHLGSAEDISAEKIALKLDDLAPSPETRGLICRHARELVDGRGAARVVRAMRGASLQIRHAEESDCRLFFEWANDPEVRAVSFSTAPIPWDRHREWFSARLADANSVLYVVTTGDGRPIGEVRYDIEGTRALVSLSLAADFRGKGYGGMALDLTMEDVRQVRPLIAIDAFVKPGNEASMRLFEQAGFRRQGDETKQGQPAVHFVAEVDGVQ